MKLGYIHTFRGRPVNYDAKRRRMRSALGRVVIVPTLYRVHREQERAVTTARAQKLETIQVHLMHYGFMRVVLP